jgi:GNAT superfamily N-acetyltransferase
MRFQIRPAQPVDARGIAHVHLESWKTTYPGIIPEAYLASLNAEDGEQRWRQRLEQKLDRTFVCYDESGIFGFISGGAIREPIREYHGELYAIYLLRQHQQQGAGRALVSTLAASLRDIGLNSMIVWVLEANSAADFYKRLGAAPVAAKIINIGGQDLPEICLAWEPLDRLL